MKKNTLFIGLNDKDTRTQIITDEQARKIIIATACEFVGGVTLSDAYGVYTHDDGERVIEHTITATIYDGDDNAIKAMIKALLLSLNQESIINEQTAVNSEFVTL